MAIIIGGHETGLLDSSFALLNRNDRSRSSDPGHGNQLFVNVSNGNLLIQERDAFLPSLGDDYSLIRTYNARGEPSEAHEHDGVRWSLSTTVRLDRLPGGRAFEVRYGDDSVFEFTYDAQRRLYVSTDGAGAYETLEELGGRRPYTPAYRVTRADQRQYTFDNQGHLLSIVDPNGVRMDYEYHADRLQRIRDDQGHVIEYVYQSGKLYQVLDEQQNVLVEYRYEGNLITEVIDRYGHSTQYVYTPNRYLERIILPFQQVGTNGELETFDRREIRFEYEQITWPRLGAKQLVTKIIDAEGGVTSFEYDLDLGGVNPPVDRGPPGRQGPGNVADRFFHGGTTVMVDALGNNRAYSNDAEYEAWRLANGYYATYDPERAEDEADYRAQVDAIRQAHSLTYTVDEHMQITEVIDQQGLHTTYEYDDQENLIAVTDRNGWGATTSDSTYYRQLRAELGYLDAAGNGKLIVELTARDKEAILAAYTSRFTYDARGNLLTSTDNEANLTRFTYTDFNKIASSTAPNGHALTTRNDASYQAQRLALGYAALVEDLSAADREALLALYTTLFRYDGNQNLIERIDPGGDITRFEYDAFGNQTRRIVFLDANDLIDPAKQQVTQFFYDEFGNNIETVDGEGHRTLSEFDHFGNLLRVIDGNQGITTFTYDNDNRLLTVTDPENHTTVNTYDAVGNRISVTDAAGHTVTRVYDRNNLLIATLDPSETDPALDRSTRFRYDVVGNRTATIDAEGRETRFVFNARREQIEVITAEVAGRDGQPTQYSSTFAYDGEGNRIRTTNNRGFSTEILYTPNNLIRQQTDANGHITRFVYDANNNQLQIIAGVQLSEAKRQVLKFSYDEEDQLVTQTDGAGQVTSFAYDAPGNRLAVTDANGHTTDFEYDHNNRLLREIRPEVIDPDTGEPIRYRVEHRYDANGNEIETIDENGHSTRFSFDKDDRLVLTEDANGIKTVFAYDSRHNRTRVQIGVEASLDADGHVNVTDVSEAQTTTFVYDEFNQLIAQIDGVGNALAQSNTSLYQTLRQQLGFAAELADLSAADRQALRALYTQHFSYDRVGNQLTSSDNLERTTQFQYDALNRLTQRTDAAGQRTTFRYDGNGNRVAQIDALGRRTQFRYDSVDRLTDTTDPLGVVTHRDYDAFGNLSAETRAHDSAAARTTAFEYDLNNRVIRQTDPGGHAQRFEYDAVGNRIRVTDARNNSTQYLYDALNRNIKIIDPLSFETQFEYDGVGNRLSLIDARGGITRFEYDPGNRSISSTDAEGRVTTFAYDVRGNRIEMRTAAGTAEEQVTVFDYDAENNLRSVLDAEGHRTDTDYDRVYNSIASTDGNGHTTTTEYDAVDRVLRITDAEGGVTAYSYDAVGNRLTQTDALGRVTTFNYDANDRLIVQTDPNEVQTHFGYDLVGNRIRITHAANTAEAATETFVYDVDDQLIEQRDALGNSTHFTYDANHNRTVVTDANGHATTYSYDANNRVSEIVDPENNRVQYRYDGNGNRTQVIDARNFVSTTYYNANNEVSLSVDAEGYATSFVYDNNGNVSAQTLHMQPLGLPLDPTTLPVVTTGPDDQTTAFEYDRLNRVTARISAEGYRSEFRYDAVGNRLETRQYRDLDGTDIASTHSYYDRVNREIASVTAEGYLTQFSYDAVGNRTQRVLYEQPINLPDSGLPQPLPDDVGRVEGFVYDAVNRLVRETSALGVHTDFEYDSRGNRTATIEAATTPDERRTVFRYDSANRLIETEDALNQVTHLVLDNNGNVVDRYEAFGTADQRQTHFDYDGNNRVIREINAAGSAVALTTELAYDGNGNLVSRTSAVGSPAQRTETFEYDANNRRTAEVNGEGERTESVYDGAGNRTRLILAPGLPEQQVNSFTYDRDNRLKTSRDGVGVHTEYRYDGAGNKLETIQAQGVAGQERHTFYVYDLDNRLLNITDPMGFVTEYEYDVLGNQTKITDAKGGVQVNTFDAIGRHVSSLSAGNILTVNSYDRRGNTLSTTQSFGDGSDARTSRYEYDLLDRQRIITDPDGFSTRIEHDPFGNQTLVTHGLYLVDPADSAYDADKAARAFAQSNNFSYDALDRLTQLTDAEGNLTEYAYDAVGNRTGLTEAANSTPRSTVFVYDKADRLLETRNPEGGIAINAYDQAGNQILERIVQSVQADGTEVWSERHFEYDANARLTAEIDPLGVRTEYSYDAMGNQTRVRRAAGTPDERVSGTAYDLNNRVSVEMDGEGNQTVFEYDRLGNRTKVIDAEGRIARYYFDASNQLISILDAEGYVNSFEYDAAGNRILERVYMSPTEAVSDVEPPQPDSSDLDRISRSEFDGNNRAIVRTESDGARTEFTYDAAGNLLREVQFANTASPRQLNYVYDLNNRLQTFTDVDGTVTEFEYDGANNKTLERIIDANDPNNVRETRFLYDLNNREISTTFDPNGLNYVQHTAYDKVGNVIASTDARGQVTHFSYDLNNRVTTETDPLGHSTLFAYDAVGNQIAVTDARGYTTQFVYDKNDRVIREIQPEVEIFTIDGRERREQPTLERRYDAVGNEVQVIDAAGYITTRYYDNNNRLSAEINGDNVLTTFEYNAAGDQTFETLYMNRVAPSAHDPNVRPTGSGEARTIRNDYDLAGRLVLVTYPFVDITTLSGTDPATNNPTSSTQRIQPTESIVYDAFGNAIEAVDPNGNRTYSYYDVKNRLIAQVDPEGYLTQWQYDAQDNVLEQFAYATPLDPATLTSETAPAPPAGEVYQISQRYDAANRLIEEYSPTVEVFDPATPEVPPSPVRVLTTYTYDANNNQTSRTLAAGTAQAQTEYTYYDAANRQIALINEQRVLHLFQYDENGNQTLQKRFFTALDPSIDLATLDALNTDFSSLPGASPDDQSKQLVYDELNRLSEETDLMAPGSGDELTKRNRYNARGERTQTIDEDGYVTQFSYNALGRALTTINADGNGTLATYDAAGNQTRVFTGQLYNVDTGEQTSLAVPVASNAISATFGETLRIGWQLPSDANVQTYVVYGGASVPSAVVDDSPAPGLGYAQQSPLQGTWYSDQAEVDLDLSDLGDASGTEVYFRVVSRDIAGNLAWSEEQHITLPPRFTEVAVSQTAADSLELSVVFAGTPVAPQLRFGEPGALDSTVDLVDQGNGVFSATLSGLSAPQDLVYQILWQDASGGTYQSEPAPFEAQGEHAGIVTSLSESSVQVEGETRYQIILDVQVPTELVDRLINLTAEWQAVGGDVTLGSLSMQDAADPADYDGQYQLVLAADEPLAAGDYQITLRGALEEVDITLDLFTVSVGGATPLSGERQSASWDAVQVGDNSRLVILGGVRVPAVSEADDTRLLVNTELAPDASADYAVFYGNTAATEHSTAITPGNNGTQLAVSVTLDAAEAARVQDTLRVAWRAADSGINFPNDVALTANGTVYSSALTLPAAGQYDLKLYYIDVDGNEVIVDWLRVDSAAAGQQSSGQSLIVLASEIDGRISRVGAELNVDPGLYTGPVAQASLPPLSLIVNGTGQAGSTRDTTGAETGYFTDNVYNALNVLTATNADTGIWREFDVDANGNALVTHEFGFDPMTGEAIKTGPPQRDSFAQYDGRNRLVARFDPAVEVAGQSGLQRPIARFGYDVHDNVTYELDARNAETVREYNALGSLTKQTDALGGVTEFHYDALGNQVREIDPLGNTRDQFYDRAGRLVREVDGEGQAVEYSYDTFDRRERMVNARGDAMEMGYDQRDRLITVTALGVVRSPGGPAENLVTTYEYDGRNNRTLTTDANQGSDNLNHTVEQVYDGLGRVVDTITYQNGTPVHDRRQYDAYGNLVVETLEFDDVQRTTSYLYAAFGRLIGVVDSGNRLTEFDYDTLGNIIHERGVHSGQDIDKTYDNGGRLTRVVDNVTGVATTYTYNLAGDRMTEVITTPEDAHNRSVSYEYDALGQLLSWSDSGEPEAGTGLALNYRWDAAGNLRQTFTPADAAHPVDHVYSYDNNNRVTSITQDGQPWQTYGYDAAGNRASYSEYLYDEQGEPVLDEEGNPVTRNLTYSFNSLGWVLTAQLNDSNQISEWQYDRVGNIKQFINRNDNNEVEVNESYNYWENNLQYQIIDHQNGQTTTQSYDPGGRLQQITVQGETTSTFSYQYTADGRIDAIEGRGKRSSGRTQYQYDVNDNPILIDQGRGDGMARNQIQTLLYNNDDQVLYSQDDSGQRDEVPAETEFVYANSNPVGETGTDQDGNPKTELDSGRYSLVQQLGNDFPADALTAYTVREGDTLQGIAAAFYGNASLWFVIAEANGLDPAQPLKEGQRIQLPNSIQSGRLTAQTHVVYDQGEVVGSTLPNLKSKKKGCGGFLAILIIVVIAIVAVIATGGLATAFLGGTAAAAGATTGATIAAYAAAGAIVGAVASVVQQGLFIALDYQDKFSWKSVAAGAIAGALSGAAQGVGQAAKVAARAGESFSYAKTASAALKITSVASKQLIENGKITSWTSLAAAGIGAAISTGRAVEVGRLAAQQTGTAAEALATAEQLVAAGVSNEALNNLTTLQTTVDYITPWVQLAETSIRNDGDLQPLDWATAVGGTLNTALTQGGRTEFSSGGRLIRIDTTLEDAARRTAGNLAVAGALSLFDKEAVQPFLEEVIGNEVGQLIGQELGAGVNRLIESLTPKPDQRAARAADPADQGPSTVGGTEEDPEKLEAPSTVEQVAKESAKANSEVAVLNGQDQGDQAAIVGANLSEEDLIALAEAQFLAERQGEVAVLKATSLDDLENARDAVIVIGQNDIDGLRERLQGGHDKILLSGQLRKLAVAQGLPIEELAFIREGVSLPSLSRENANFLLEQLELSFAYDYPEGTQSRLIYIPESVSAEEAKKAIVFDIGKRVDDLELALITDAVDQTIATNGGGFVDVTVAYNQSTFKAIEERLNNSITDDVAGLTSENLSSVSAADILRDPVGAAGAFVIDLLAKTVDNIAKNSTFSTDELAPADLREDATSNLILEGALFATGGIGKVAQVASRAFQAARNITVGLRTGRLGLRSPIVLNRELLSLSRLNANPLVAAISLRNPLIARNRSFIADAGVFLDRVPGGDVTRRLLDNALGSDFKVIVPKANLAEVSPTTSQLARLTGASDVKAVRSANIAKILRENPDILSRRFGVDDLKLVATAKRLNLPIVTVNSRLRDQINSNAIRQQLFGNVRILVPGDDFTSTSGLARALTQ